MTGVSKFSKVSLFSGLNNLNDITLDAPYAAICGYTDHDINTVFASELPGLDCEEIRRWYNGYRWGGKHVDTVYNPFDVLLLLQKCEFGPYWFESATPNLCNACSSPSLQQ
nr:AAA family ATPase [Halomonas sp. TG39a]